MEFDSPFFDTQADLFQEEDVGRTPLPSNCLECHGEVTSSMFKEDIPDGGLLRCNEIRILFSNAEAHLKYLDHLESIELFSNNFDTDITMTERLHILFRMARKNFFLLESDAIRINLSIGPTQRTQKVDYYKIRQQLCLFFSFIRSNLLSIPGNVDLNWIIKEIRNPLMILLKDWRILLQGFSTLPSCILSNCSSRQGNKCTHASYHLFHCHLEMRWYNLCVLYAFLRTDDTKAETRQLLKQDIELCLAELVYLAESIFKAATMEGIDKFVRHTPFSCTCVREFWLLLQLVADKLHNYEDLSHTFWSLLDQQLQPYLTEQRNTVITNDCSKLKWPRLGQDSSIDKPSFCFWLLYHLAMLYGYGERGIHMDFLRSNNVSDAAVLLENILKTTVSSDIQEARLREIVHILLILPSWWPLGASPLLVLWEIFLRRINSFFTLPSETLNTMAVISRTALGLSLQIKEYARPVNELGDGDNSYTMFLRLLGQQLNTVSSDQSALDLAWRQLKGRIYPKFPPTRIETMTELGLYHLASLMLTLAVTVDINEVGERLQEMLASVPKGREVSKRSVVWKTHLALLLLRTERGLELESTARLLLQLVEETCNKLTVFSNNEFELMRLYVEGVHEIADAIQDRNIAIQVFVGKWIRKYLEVCSITDACRTLDALQAVTNTIKTTNDTTSSTGGQELYSKLKEHVLPYLMEQSKLPNSATQKIADLAISLTMASADVEFIKLFMHFVSSENVNVKITARYLTQMLQNAEALQRVVTKIQNHHNIIIQAWVKCCLLSNDAQTEVLTNSVAKLPQLITLCGGSTDLLLDSSEPLESLAQLLASRLQSIELLRDKQALKDQTLACLGRIDKVAEAAIKHGKLPPAVILKLYQSTGSLVASCALLMYTKGSSNCLMKGIISQLLLPMSILKPEYVLPQDITAALRQTLPLFLKGIARLGPKNDIYVARTIRECVTHYIPRLALSDRNAMHPIKDCLEDTSELTIAILDAMKISFFSKKQRTLPTGGIQALQILFSLILENDSNVWLVREIVSNLLECLLNQMIWLEENSQAKHQVASTIKEMLNCMAFRDTPEMQELFTNRVEKILGNMGFHQAAVFRVLTWLATMRRSLLVPSLTHVRNEIAKVETLRGTGRDNSLRTALDKLESQLGVAST